MQPSERNPVAQPIVMLPRKQFPLSASPKPDPDTCTHPRWVYLMPGYVVCVVCGATAKAEK
jgi:hypothetical protein